MSDYTLTINIISSNNKYFVCSTIYSTSFSYSTVLCAVLKDIYYSCIWSDISFRINDKNIILLLKEFYNETCRNKRDIHPPLVKIILEMCVTLSYEHSTGHFKTKCKSPAPFLKKLWQIQHFRWEDAKS